MPDRVRVFADLPGCDRDRIQLRANDNQLRIEAEREDPVNDRRAHRHERAPTIERTIDIPTRANIDEAEAAYENGVLRIDLPKREEEKERTIGFE
ncbi:Hsp20/alpha crystallin family protein [Halocalculus aciditolerans]|uniref:SHSP domain-containing protein n=1 Tax=Halocalculus aciditolerans TaxID=1383812 RepID=A0A830FKN8_9EURY|nr:Hsp20/alpha crystallin family protein [Halocalculus aciditolerans]GGL61779.1 hypothetical protein GCM10009039_19960 [Halocalculus aciditolerans]